MPQAKGDSETDLPLRGRKWRLLFEGQPRQAAENMAIDEALMRAHADGETPPVLRFYQWSPPALSIGYFQSFEREVDAKGCRSLGFDWVRRPTGGRAVLHEDELTYSVVISEKLLSGSVLKTYSALSQALASGLRQLGVQAQLSGGRPPTREDRQSSSAACFDTPTVNEVAVDGKKLIGSAQVRRRGVILQHGSVPLRLNRDNVVRCLRLPSERLRKRVLKTLQDKAASLCEVCGYKPQFDQVAESLRTGFEEALDIEFAVDKLSPAERQDVHRLVEEKYGRCEFTRQR